jgi:putative aldouronate transport system substrate-binding protein
MCGIAIKKGGASVSINMKTIILYILIFFLIFTGCNGSASHFNGTVQEGHKTKDENAETLPISKRRITFYFMGIDMNPNITEKDETDFMKKLEEETGIHIEWKLIPESSWTEEKNIAIMSGNLPDAFYGIGCLTSEEIEKYAADGTIIKLDDLISKYAPNIQKILETNKLYNEITRNLDGHIYALAQYEDLGFDSHSVAIIKKKWLDELGLSMPRTTEDFYNVLKAFKERDPNRNGIKDEIPFSFLYMDGPMNREVKREHFWIFGAFGINDNPIHIHVKDNGEVIFTADKERWKEAVKYLHSLYADGLIDHEVFTQDRKLLTHKVRYNKNIGVYTDYRKKWSFIPPEEWDDYEVLPPLIGPYGDQSWDRALVGINVGSFAITKKCENPEILMKWINYTLKPENAIQMNYGMFQTDKSKFSEKRYLIPSTEIEGKWTANDDYKPAHIDANDWLFSSPIATAFTIITRDTYNEYIHNKPSVVAKEEDCSVYRPYLTKYPYNIPYKFTLQEIEELNKIQPKLLDYINKTQAKWIVYGNIDQEWDEYIAQLQKLDVDKYTAIHKNAFNRIKHLFDP